MKKHLFIILIGWAVLVVGILVVLLSPLVGGAVAAAETSRLSIEDTSMRRGESRELPVMLDSAPAGVAGFDIIVEVSGAAVEITSAGSDLPLSSISISNASSTDVRIRAVDLDNSIVPGMTSIQLASVTVQGIQSGTSSLRIVVIRLDDDSGAPINRAIDEGVIQVSMLVLPGQLAPVADLDDDGIAEDLNGNGRFDFQDIVLLFQHMDTIDPSDAGLFDFDGNGLLGFNDVVGMFNRLIDGS